MTKPSSDAQRVELRGDIPRDIIDFLDAVGQADNVSRIAVVERLLREAMDREVGRMTRILRMINAPGNGG